MHGTFQVGQRTVVIVGTTESGWAYLLASSKVILDARRLTVIDIMIDHANLFAGLPANWPDELFTTLLEAATVRIERIVSHGHASPAKYWYDQEQHEWVVVLKGLARLRFEDGELEFKHGGFVKIPEHRKHRVEWTTSDEPTICLAVHYGDGI